VVSRKPGFGCNVSTGVAVRLNSRLENIIPVDSLEDLEDLDEEVDDVQVELDGGGDVLLRGDTGHDHLQMQSSATQYL